MTHRSRATALFDNSTQPQRGTILRKPGSKKLYVLFSYQGERIEKSTGLDDTPLNRKRVRLKLDELMQAIADGHFVFAEAFPQASAAQKARFAKREAQSYRLEPHQVFFGDFVKTWLHSIWRHWEEGCKKDDYGKDIQKLLPFFARLSFFEISGMQIQAFIATLKHEKGPKRGQPLSRQRIKNLLIPLRALFYAACDEYRWTLPDPFAQLKRHLPKKRPARRLGFRVDEWMAFLDHLDEWHKPICELMIMTGLIASEVAGLKKSDIRGGYLHVVNSVVRGRAQEGCKTPFRERKIPITCAIAQRLAVLVARSPDERVVTGRQGGYFRASTLADRPWKNAAAKSGITDKVPYSLRHSFAAWALCVRIDPNRLVALMGHSTKKMVYETYGTYIEGLNADAQKILDYFGRDFLQGDAAL